MKIKDVTIVEALSSNNQGEILELGTDFVVIGCESGSLKIKTIQAPSKKALNAADYIRGQRLAVKDIIQ